MYLQLSRGRMGEGIVWEFGMDMYTLLYLKWATNQPSLFFTLSAGNSAQSYVAAWMGVEFGGAGMDTCLCMAEFLFCTPANGSENFPQTNI